MNATVKTERVVIAAPNMQEAQFTIVGTAPLVINRFSSRSTDAIRAAQEAGSQAKSKKVREPKDFEALYEDAKYKSIEGGWDGINAAAFRNALISVCRLVGYKMTLAKLSIFVVADGVSACGTPLVRIYTEGGPRMDVRPARNANGGFDLKSRPMWLDWHCKLRLQWDADQFSLTDVTNLLSRAGLQCGTGDGRPNSRMSAGIGWGTFRIDA